MTGGGEQHQILRSDKWSEISDKQDKVSLWEEGVMEHEDTHWRVERAPFQRELAALGIAYWEEVTGSYGTPITLEKLYRKYKVNQGKDRIREQYHNLKAYMGQQKDQDWWKQWTQTRENEDEDTIDQEDSDERYHKCNCLYWRDAPAQEGTVPRQLGKRPPAHLGTP